MTESIQIDPQAAFASRNDETQLRQILDQLTSDTTPYGQLAAAARLIELLSPRPLDGETPGIALTVMGLDIYVHDQGERFAVSVNADDADKPAVIESFDGISWEQPLP